MQECIRVYSSALAEPPNIGSQFQMIMSCFEFVFWSKCILQTQRATGTFYHFQKRDHGEVSSYINSRSAHILEHKSLMYV